MAIQLTTPITVTDGPLSGSATHENLGATIQPWNDTECTLYMTAGAMDAAAHYRAINGTRSDTAKASPEYAALTSSEWASMSTLPEWQAALAKALEIYRWIAAGRPAASKPTWLS